MADRYGTKLMNRVSSSFVTRAAVFLTLLSYSVLLGKPAFVDFWAGREMVFETLGALAFLATALLFADGAKRALLSRRRFALAGLALFFFVAAGEELSWGQHLLGFDTPEGLKNANVQQEFNLHNLAIFDSYDARTGEKKEGRAAWLNSNRLFDYFMVGFFWLLPALAPWWRERSWFKHLGALVPARSLGLLLLLNLGLSLLAELTLVDGMLLHLAVSETRELGYAWLCGLAAWQLRGAQDRESAI